MEEKYRLKGLYKKYKKFIGEKTELYKIMPYLNAAIHNSKISEYVFSISISFNQGEIRALRTERLVINPSTF